MERYSVYEAKAHLSAILGLVKKNKRVCVTDRGKDIAWIIPSQNQTETVDDLETHLEALTQARVIQGGRTNKKLQVASVAKRPGALQRFLDERDEG